MWKAVLVLFMTSNTQPVSMMIGQFPEKFTDKAACQSFIASKDGEVEGTVKVITRYAQRGYKVLNHNLHCIEDGSGEPV